MNGDEWEHHIELAEPGDAFGYPGPRVARATARLRAVDGACMSFPAIKVGTWVPVSDELLEDPIGNYRQIVGELLADRLNRITHPWEYSDRPAIEWTFDPFPRLTRITRTLKRITHAP